MEATQNQIQNSNDGGPSVLTLTRKEAAERLNISTSMLDLLTKRGAIAVCRIGRRRLYRPEALADYVRRTEKQSRAA